MHSHSKTLPAPVSTRPCRLHLSGEAVWREEGSQSRSAPAGERAPCPNFWLFILSHRRSRRALLLPPFIPSICPTEYLSNSWIRRETVSFWVQRSVARGTGNLNNAFLGTRKSEVCTYSQRPWQFSGCYPTWVRFPPSGQDNKHECPLNDFIHRARFPSGREKNPYAHVIMNIRVNHLWRKKQDVTFTYKLKIYTWKIMYWLFYSWSSAVKVSIKYIHV